VSPLDRAAIGILLGLLERDEMRMRQIVAASGAPHRRAREARARLEALGLVGTEHRGQGAVRIARVRLTPRGRRVALLLAQAHRLLAETFLLGAWP